VSGWAGGSGIWLLSAGARPRAVGEVDVLIITDRRDPSTDGDIEPVRRAVTTWSSSAAVAAAPVTDTLIWVDEGGERRGGADRERHRVVRWPLAIAGTVARQLPVDELWDAAVGGPAALVGYLNAAGIPVLPVD
jgi:hypothetical protein